MSLVALAACSGSKQRGIADKRTNFAKFLPMEGDPHRYGLRTVRPRFSNGDRSGVEHAIASACQGGKEGSSDFNPRSDEGYYVNCNPRNRQLLNGYVPVDPAHMPHSH
ncbi:MAG: hypothetical protein WA324_17300 [Bryobacteraceae bacterium]